MKRSVEVKIMGQSFTVTSEEGEEHLHKVAEVVDTTMRQVAGGAGAVTTVNVAILAALNIASECQKLKEEREVIQHTLARLSTRVQQGLND